MPVEYDFLAHSSMNEKWKPKDSIQASPDWLEQNTNVESNYRKRKIAQIPSYYDPGYYSPQKNNHEIFQPQLMMSLPTENVNYRPIMQEQHPQPYSYQNPELGLFIWEPGPSQSYYSRLPTKPKFQNMHSQPPIIDSNLLHHWPVGYQATENLITPLQNYPGVVGLNNHVGNGNQIYGPSEIIEPIILQIDAQLPRENPSGTHSASDLSYSTHSEEEGDPTWTSYEDSESSALSSSVSSQHSSNSFKLNGSRNKKQ
ncbi:hypothetical protein BY996DRAFT_6412077 [Phakopsora pachyrhizi]|nr:hypothetical protein BY996DRAFT_6412077 [Phakopsora pachyrhizi]